LDSECDVHFRGASQTWVTLDLVFDQRPKPTA
jgi:hypothetical protein